MKKRGSKGDELALKMELIRV